VTGLQQLQTSVSVSQHQHFEEHQLNRQTYGVSRCPCIRWTLTIDDWATSEGNATYQLSTTNSETGIWRSQIQEGTRIVMVGTGGSRRDHRTGIVPQLYSHLTAETREKITCFWRHQSFAGQRLKSNLKLSDEEAKIKTDFAQVLVDTFFGEQLFRSQLFMARASQIKNAAVAFTKLCIS
jgi:hypothetical protein